MILILKKLGPFLEWCFKLDFAFISENSQEAPGIGWSEHGYADRTAIYQCTGCKRQVPVYQGRIGADLSACSRNQHRPLQQSGKKHSD